MASCCVLRPWQCVLQCGTSGAASWLTLSAPAAEITDESFDIQKYKEIMGVVARRLQDSGEDWRHVYKSLLLLEFMSKHGPHKVAP